MCDAIDEHVRLAMARRFFCKTCQRPFTEPADSTSHLPLPEAAAAGTRGLAALQLMRRNPLKLTPEMRWRVRTWLADKPARRELWAAKESLNRLYRVRGRDRAKRALAMLTDALAFSLLPELLTLPRTLIYWRKEILAYFYCRLTNARTEGFNGKAKLVIRRAYGYKSFRNYRLRLLNSCA